MENKKSIGGLLDRSRWPLWIIEVNAEKKAVTVNGRKAKFSGDTCQIPAWPLPIRVTFAPHDPEKVRKSITMRTEKVAAKATRGICYQGTDTLVNGILYDPPAGDDTLVRMLGEWLTLKEFKERYPFNPLIHYTVEE